MTSEKFKAIWPLPGGVSGYVDTLTRILKKIQESSPTFDELLKWFISEYKLTGEKTPKAYLEYIRRFGFFKISDNRLLLTDISLKFLESGDYKVVYEVLNNAVLGLGDILTWSNMPSYNATSMDIEQVATAYRWYNWSVTYAVQKAVDGIHGGPDIVTIVMLETSFRSLLSSVTFYSKEGSSYYPELTVHWSGIVSEFPSIAILTLFMIATLLAVIVYERKIFLLGDSKRKPI